MAGWLAGQTVYANYLLFSVGSSYALLISYAFFTIIFLFSHTFFFFASRIISTGEKTIALNNRFYCEKCAPPQIPREKGEDGDNESTKVAQSPEGSPSKSIGLKRKKKQKVPKSPSLPQRFGEIFRSKKTHPQTPQPNSNNPSILPNGTDALSVNVGKSI